ncbi:hypothetical protein Q1695_010167 [Nippostrongylus brasiliensis]|nr:hypothetical protein Q1695_010167 [Nippostrongylus brasiliensis]
MSGFVTCPHCARLYSQHSLHLHESKCLENPLATRRASMVSLVKAMSLRPRTRSTSRPAGVQHRLCYVCGEQFTEQDIAAHENKCIDKWTKTCERLAPRFESRTPLLLQIPSVDGTIDARRLNEHAITQSSKAQTLRCRRCNCRVVLNAAEQHRCDRFDPPVEFFF